MKLQAGQQQESLPDALPKHGSDRRAKPCQCQDCGSTLGQKARSGAASRSASERDHRRLANKGNV